MMEIEYLFRSTARAVGLKPSASQGEARLRGLWQIIYSKTIISVIAWGASFPGVFNTDGGRWLLSDRHARRSPHWGGDCDCARPRRFNLYENCYKCSIAIIHHARRAIPRSVHSRPGGGVVMSEHRFSAFRRICTLICFPPASQG
jgi:hypothetical protein